jgi:metal-responsive CopG/Arc/MetJ family transcriptional regulator
VAASEKIAISLPVDLVKRIEKERRRTGETRSAFIRRAVRLMFRAQSHAARVREYVEGYGRDPETEDEVRAAEAAAARLLAGEPWE